MKKIEDMLGYEMVREFYEAGKYHKQRMKPMKFEVEVTKPENSNKTVKEIQDMVANHNANLTDIPAERDITADSIQAIADEEDVSLKLAELIHRHAYEAGHSSGVQEVFNYAMDFAEFAKEARKIK